MTTGPSNVAPPAVRELPPSEAEAWDAYLAGRPEATLYQTAAWAHVVRRVFGHRMAPLACEAGEALRGVLPLYRVHLPLLGAKLLSIPFDVFSGGPLADDAAAEAALLEACRERGRASRAGYLQLRCRGRLAEAERLGFRESSPLVVTRMEVAGEEEAWSNVSKHHRRSVKTAAKRGVAVRLAESLEDVRSFQRVYLRTFRAFGTPPYPWKYFRIVWEELRPVGGVHVIVASMDGADVGGMLLFGWNRTLVMKFAVGLEEAVAARVYAALYWRAIQLAAERGYRDVSWGSSAPKQTGLIEFKERWGAVTQPVVFYDLPLRGEPPDIEKYYDSEGFVRKAWTKLPLWTTGVLGGPLNRWFC